MTVRDQTCRFHCVQCCSHFASLAAFDAHREGGPDDRHCIDPEDAFTRGGQPRLEVKTMRGRCDLAVPGSSVAPAVIFSTFGSGDRDWTLEAA